MRLRALSETANNDIFKLGAVELRRDENSNEYMLLL